MSDPYNPSGYPQGQAGVHQAPPIGAQGAVVQPYGQPGQAYTGTGYASAPSGGYASAPSADGGYDAGYQQYQGGYQQPGYQQPYAGAYAVARKSKIAAGLLGIFLGSLGVHNFYLGRDARGGLQLGLTVAGVILSFIFVGLFVLLGVEVWALVEGILILAATPGAGRWGVDARGVPLSD